MTSIAMDSSAENAGKKSSKLRFFLKKVRKGGVRSAAFLWRWVKWPALIFVCLVAAYFIVPPVLKMLGLLMGSLLQLVLAIVSIAAACLWTSISHLFGGAALLVSYSYWPCASERISDTSSMLDWGVWTSKGVMVYVWGGLTGFLIAYTAIRSIRRSMASRAQQKRQRAETEAVRAKEKLTAELELRFEQGHAAGVSAERNVVRRAFIHAYKPKTSLPTIPAGHTRLFWISVRLHERDLYPTQNRMVHWADVEGAVPERAIGAPAYQRVTTNEGDLLAMMGVVYKLDSQASAW